MSASALALQVEGLSVRYQGAQTLALEDVDLAVAAGQVHALVGQNGAGKSTLLHVLGGVVSPTAGRVLLRGQPFAPRGPADARRKGIALIHQELALAPHLSVEANVLLGAEPTRGVFLHRRRARVLARDALALLGRVDVPLGARVRDLSPSVRQLVEIARAMALRADVLLLDEPTSSLTRAEIEPLFALLARLRAQGKALVYISHHLDEVRAVATRCTVLRDGRVVARGDPAQFSNAQLAAAMVGRDVAAFYPRSARAAGEEVLRVQNLCRPPVVDASFALRRGEILGIVGLMGAGRSELVRAVFGLDAVRSGNVRAAAFTQGDSVAARWRGGVGFASEDRKHEGLALRASIADNVTWPALARTARGPFVTRGAGARATRALIDTLQIRCDSEAQLVGTLSGGNQQKVALARLLYARCDVLLLDEPTRGIDVAAKADIYRLLDELVVGVDPSRPRAAVVLVSSDPHEVLGACDRVAVMRNGRLGPARPVADVDAATLMRAAMGSDVDAAESSV